MTTIVQTVLTLASTVTASGALVAGRHTPVDATSGAVTMTLPTPTTIGARLRVEKVDTSTNAVIVSGTIRGAAATVSLYGRYEVVDLFAETLTSWRVEADHKPKSWFDATYVTRVAAITASGVTTWPARPTGVPAGQVQWVGSGVPAGILTGDTLVNF